jgi:hypothetical protein
VLKHWRTNSRRGESMATDEVYKFYNASFLQFHLFLLNSWLSCLANTNQILRSLRGCNLKFLDWVDNEIKTTINTRWKATQRVMAAQLTRMTHKIAIQLHLVAESCTICSSHSRRPFRKLLDTPSYVVPKSCGRLHWTS